MNVKLQKAENDPKLPSPSASLNAYCASNDQKIGERGKVATGAHCF